MSVLFYRWSSTTPAPAAPDLPDLKVRIWSPARDGFPSAGVRRAQNAAWLALTMMGALSPPGLFELSLWQDRRMVHRMVITPRWYRFPFMAKGDLQLGDLWTDPSMRRHGFARAAVAEACRRLGVPGIDIWYLTDAGNEASCRVAEACGFQLVGIGRRTRPMGIGLLGRYQLLMPAA